MDVYINIKKVYKNKTSLKKNTYTKNEKFKRK